MGLHGGGTQQEVGNFEVSVGDLNNSSIISLKDYSIFQTATIGSEKYFYNPSTGVLTNTGTLTVNLTYHSALMTTSTSTIKGVLTMSTNDSPNAIPNGTTLSGTPGIYNEDFSVDSSSFTLGFTNNGKDQDFSLSFTFTNALFNISVSPVFSLEFEVTQ